MSSTLRGGRRYWISLVPGALTDISRDTRGRSFTRVEERRGEMCEKRLAENANKMADGTSRMADHRDFIHSCLDDVEDVRSVILAMDRPVHKAFRSGKLLCPKQECLEKLLFFEETGIDHHFRVKHNAEFSGSDHQSSIRARRTLHEKETRECLEQIFKYRRSKVLSRYLFQYS